MTEAEVILIVDDEPLNISLLEQELEDLGYLTIAAASGPEALKRMEAAAPDLVLLDIMMPVMDGFEVLSRIKADESWRHIPVVIISAMNDMSSIIRGIKLGAEDYLSKPFDPVLLQARLSSSLERKRLRDAEQMYLKAMARELEIGRQIQLDFLPETLPTPAGWDISVHFQAAREVAGDFYDVFTIDAPHKIGVMVGDVCDKGVGAALYMALFRSLLRAASRQVEAGVDAEVLLRHAIESTNNYISVVHQQATMFTTLFYGVLDSSTGRLNYVNAGQEPALVVAGQAIKASLQATAPAIGLIPNAPFTIGRYDLQPGETLLIYSDGVPDALNEAGDQMGVAQISSIATEQPPGSAQAMLDRVSQALYKHIGSADQFDDITLMAIRRTA